MAKEKMTPIIPPASVPVVTEPAGEVDFGAMLERATTNGNHPVRQFNFATARLLTRPLTAMKHKRECAIQAESELYERDLPVAGRSDKPVKATLLDFMDLQSGTHEIMVCSAVMVTAFKDASASVPLKGRCFLLRAGDIVADKRYRHVDVAELLEK
jgi:hypothetical protein